MNSTPTYELPAGSKERFAQPETLSPLEVGQEVLVNAAMPGIVTAMERIGEYLDQEDFEGALDAGLTSCLNLVESHLSARLDATPADQGLIDATKQYQDTMRAVGLTLRILENQPATQREIASHQADPEGELPEYYDFIEREHAISLVNQELRRLARMMDSLG